MKKSLLLGLALLLPINTYPRNNDDENSRIGAVVVFCAFIGAMFGLYSYDLTTNYKLIAKQLEENTKCQLENTKQQEIIKQKKEMALAADATLSPEERADKQRTKQLKTLSKRDRNWALELMIKESMSKEETKQLKIKLKMLQQSTSKATPSS